MKVLNPLGEDEYIDDREKDKRERKKFVDASKMRRVSKIFSSMASKHHMLISAGSQPY